MAGVVRLQWTRLRNGFDLVDDQDQLGRGYTIKLGDPSTDEGLFWFKPREPQIPEPYVLEGTANRIFLELANVGEDSKKAQAFVSKWGPLGEFYDVSSYVYDDDISRKRGELYDQNSRSTVLVYGSSEEMRQAIAYSAGDRVSSNFEAWMDNGERVADRKAEEFRNVVDGFLRDGLPQEVHTRRPPRQDQGSSLQIIWPELRLRRGKLHGDTASRVFLEAKTLRDFCTAELIQWLGTGNEIRRCPTCGTLFAVGKAGTQPTYCSNACRITAHRRQKRAQAAPASNTSTIRAAPVRRP